MRFQVPQFIDIEDKIFGPFTFKQFIYLLGGAGGAYVFYRLLPIIIAIPLIIAVIGLALALTFLKINGRPFPEILQSWFSYFFKSKLFIWKQAPKNQENKKVNQEKEVKEEKIYIPKLTEGKLKDISWSLDVLDMDKNKRK
ncbi:MAG: hypothetical protein QG580_464 [Patescibacteria group bacterium]|jgi:hypothetical protein|nr:hypothetical protein [Patescibacteria group bacterium]